MLFLRFAVLNVFLLAWNGTVVVKAVRRRRDLPHTIVLLGVAVFVTHLLEVVLLLRSLGMSPEKAFYNCFGLFVLLLGAGATQNVLALRRLETRRSGAYSLLAYNSLMCVCAFFFWLNLQPGLELPFFLQTIVRAYIRTQEIVMSFFARFLPSLHFFPILALPWGAREPGEGRLRAWLAKPGRALRRLPPIYAALVVLVVLFSFGNAAQDVRLYKKDIAGPVRIRPGLHFGVKVQCETEGPFERRLGWYEKELNSAEELGVDCLMHYLPTDFMESEERIVEFETMVRLARERGFTVMMAFAMANDWFFRSSEDISDEEYDRRVREACVVAAKRIRPRYLNPVVEPYGAQQLLGKRIRTPGEWRMFLNGLADRIHAIAPEIIVGTNLSNIHDTKSEALFRMLCAPDCSIDGPGLSINTGIGPLEDIFAAYSRWLAWIPPEKECWVYEFAITPLNFGQGAQARYIRRVADWAAREPRIAGISYYPLNDFSEPMGLIAFGRHKRSGFDAYRKITAATRQRSPGPQDTD